MGSRGNLHRPPVRRVAGLLTAKPNLLRRPVALVTYLDKADLKRLEDTANARLVRVDFSAMAPDRQSGNEPGAGDRSGCYLLLVELGGQVGKNTCGASAVVSSKAIGSKDEKRAAGVGRNDATQGVCLKLQRKTLESRLVTLTRVPLGPPLVFESQLFLSAEASAPVDDCLRSLLEGLKSGDGPETIASLEEALLTSLLTYCRHNYSLRFREVTRTGPSRHVKLAEDYILNNAEKRISMKDLERVTAVSARSIHLAFRRFRGYSPKALLQAVRLDRAHKSLLAADPSDQVMTIAASCGFAHLGRFSAAYKKRFGELPSQTLTRK